MRVSIGIPCYGQAQYLPEAIESALNQTHQCEVIVVIDGSPDNSEEIARKYPVKVIRQVNKGLASARNAAIMNMHKWQDPFDNLVPDSEIYFLPLDSDDILEPNCVARMLEVAEKTKADIIAPSIHCFGLGEQDVIMMQNPQLEDFKEGNRIPYCSMIKKEALLECGGYSPRMDKGWEDLHLTYDLLLRGKTIATIQEPLVRYRTKGESMWTEARDKYGPQLQAQIDKDFPHLFN